MQISHNNFTSVLRHLRVILQERHVTARGALAAVLTLACAVTSVTDLIGLSASRCGTPRNPYARLTPQRRTQCYKQNVRACPISGRKPAALAERLNELLVMEEDVALAVCTHYTFT